MEKEIYRYAEKHQVIVGICSPERLTHILPVLEKQPTPFVSPHPENRIDPGRVLSGAESVIVIGKSYAKCAERKEADQLTGMISQIAVGVDYHVTVQAVLRGMAERLKGWSNFKYRIYADNGPVVERALAVKAGLGFYGKNHGVISHELGSLFNIGWMVTDLPLRESVNLPTQACLGCNACVTHCPGGALDCEGRFDYQKCVSYLTQKPGELTGDEKGKLYGWVYGCDLCQIHCPYNADISAKVVEWGELFPALDGLCRMTDDQFDERFGHTSAGWRGPAVLRRNAEAAMRNISSGNGFIIQESGRK